MRVPKYIKDAIHRACWHNAIATKSEDIVREWAEVKGLPTFAWEDVFLDTFGYASIANMGADALIKELEEYEPD